MDIYKQKPKGKWKAKLLEEWYQTTSQENRDMIDKYTANLNAKGVAKLGGVGAHECVLATIYWVATHPKGL